MNNVAVMTEGGASEVRAVNGAEQQEQNDYAAANPTRTIYLNIRNLEETVTSRRLREAILGTDAGWLVAIEAQIVALRNQL